MKKILILSLVMLIIMLTGCSVNSTTGLIKFTNNSDKDVTVKIGTTSTFVSKGATYDYYFSADIKGKISAEGCEDVYYEDDHDDDDSTPAIKYEEATFKPSFFYFVSISKNDGKYYVNAGGGYKAGVDMAKDDGRSHNIWTDKIAP